MTDSANKPASELPRRRSRAHRFGLATLLAMLLVAGVAAGGVYLMIGQTLRAPDWVQQRIESRIESGLGGLRIGFSDVEFVLRKGWRPRLRLRGMTLESADGQRIVQLNTAEASLAMRPLLRGQVQPKRIYLDGAFATLRRDRDGNIALLFGDGAASITSAANLAGLIEEWEQVLVLPQLSALTRLEIATLTLRYEDLRQGRAWTLDGGRIQLDRVGDALRAAAGFALLGGGDVAGLVEANYASRIGETQADFGISVRDIAAGDIAAQSVALNWLGVLRAPISGSLRGNVDNAGMLGPLSATLQIGPGVVQPNDQARPIPFQGARSYFTYAPGDQVLRFDELSVASAWGSGSAEGSAYLGGVENGRLSDLIGQFTLTGLSFNPADLYAEPQRIERADTDFRLELTPFRLTIGQMHVSQTDASLLLSGALEAGPDGWNLALDGRVDAMTPDRLVAIWPDGAAAKARDWVRDNLSGGQLRDLNMALRLAPGRKPDVFVDFDYQDTQVRFLRSMPPITAATGQVSLNGRRLVVTATSGKVKAEQGGAVDVSGTSFIIPDIGIRHAAPGIVRFAVAGPVTAIVSLLNRPPLQVLKGTPLPVDLARGTARVSGTLSLPLKPKVPFDELEFHFDGDIASVSSTVLVPGHEMSAASLRVSGTQNGVEVGGDARIGAVPANAVWRQPLGAGQSRQSRVEGTVELSQTLVDTFDIGLPPGTVSGAGQGAFTLDLGPGEAPRLQLRSDLTGLQLRLPQLGWFKSPATSGTLQMDGTLGQQARVDQLVLRGAGLAASGSVLNRPDGGLQRAAFQSVRLGGWLDARVEMIGRGAAPPAIRVLGGTLDLRQANFESGGGGAGGSSPLEVTLDRLQITDTIALTDFNGRFTTTGGLTGDFTGKVNGATPVTGQVVPQGGRSAVRLQSGDAGGVFRSAGILRQGRGGDFGLTLVPVGREGQFNGVLRVTNTRVKDAPAIAALLNSVSVIGLLDEMSGQGIQFTEVDAKFVLGPSTLRLVSSSAVGPSLGISMDGTFDVPTGRLNMRGVISPVYILNSIGAVLTRKGEGLLGFNYNLRGTAQKPAVSVNPLSALAPGAIREIFRAPAPRDPEAGDEARSPGRRAPDLTGTTAEGR